MILYIHILSLLFTLETAHHIVILIKERQVLLSFALQDHFFLLYLDGKRVCLVNSPYHFCSAVPESGDLVDRHRATI